MTSSQISRMGVYGVARREEKVLLVTQDGGPYVGKLDFPGGKIEFGESLEKALHREFFKAVRDAKLAKDLELEIVSYLAGIEHKRSYVLHF